MRATFALVAFAVLAAAEPVPGGVSSAVSPKSSPPPGCSPNYDGEFEIAPANVASDGKRDLIEERQHTRLAITLQNGILTDTQGRTGYIASNQQFQFDDPPQAGAIWTAGFTVCPNRTLALGNDVIWYRCQSGNFYNLYLHNSAGQCIESYIIAEAVGNGHPVPVSTTPSSSPAPASSSAPPSSAPSSSAPVSSSSKVISATGHGHHHVNSTSSMNVTISSSSSTTAKHTTKHHTAVHHTTSPPHKSPAKSSSSSSSSSSSTGAAEPVGVRGDMFGLAAGLLAFALI